MDEIQSRVSGTCGPIPTPPQFRLQDQLLCKCGQNRVRLRQLRTGQILVKCGSCGSERIYAGRSVEVADRINRIMKILNYCDSQGGPHVGAQPESE